MKNEKINLHFLVVTGIVLGLAFSRMLPHPFNFSPIAALALFGGARYSNRFAAYLIPLAAVWISDLFLNYAFYGRFVPFYNGALITYLAFALIVLLGSVMLRRLTPGNLLFSSLSASLLFFIVSNFGVWAFSGMYPLNMSGFSACYAAAIPFLRNTITGDLIYSFAVFYAFAFAQQQFPSLSVKALKA
ncbi:MAG: DUF6580 family putative transport protein [Bacteroidota bacterium]